MPREPGVTRAAAPSALAADPGRRRTQEPEAYLRAVSVAAEQIASQLPTGATDWASVIVMPVVGFGDQYRDVLERTLRLLNESGGGARRLLVAVVNRPQHQPEDGAADVLDRFADTGPSGLDLVVCRLALERRTRMGEVRQLAVDALERVLGELPADTPVLVCDDDVVALPARALPALELAIRRGAGLAVGPVLFDDPQRPMCLYGDQFVADLFRALVGRRMLTAWQPESGSRGGDPEALESMIFSGNLAVARGALAAAGGFRDLNEITWLARDVLAEPQQRLGLVDPVASAADPTTRLLAHGVRMSSRRALAAWRQYGHPSVAQWRACRFTASRVDPARRASIEGLPARVSDMPAAARHLLAESAGRALSATCRYLDPPPDVAREALAALGLTGTDIEVRPGSADRRIVIRRDDAFLDWLDRMQEEELARWNALAVETLPSATSTSDPA